MKPAPLIRSLQALGSHGFEDTGLLFHPGAVARQSGEARETDLHSRGPPEDAIEIGVGHGEGVPEAIILVGQFQVERLEMVHDVRSEEHTSELQSLMRISYAVFCLTNKTT